MKAGNVVFCLITPLCMGTGQAVGFRIAKSDFHLLAVEVQCAPTCDFSDEVAGAAVDFGYAGEGKFADLSKLVDQNADPRGPRIVAGFPEERFDWSRFTQPLPGGRNRMAVLNELTSSGKNYAFLSAWKPFRDSLEFIRLLPGSFSIPLGEISFRGAPRSQGGATLLLLQGIGSDAGINLQAFFAVRLQGDRLQKVREVSNKTEIPVADILARLNDDKPAEEVLDSALQCDLAKTGTPALHCVKTRTKILYTQQGPQETPLGKENFTLDLAR